MRTRLVWVPGYHSFSKRAIIQPKNKTSTREQKYANLKTLDFFESTPRLYRLDRTKVT